MIKETLVTMSTAHLSLKTIDKLYDYEEDESPIVVHSYDYGFLIRVKDDYALEELPNDLQLLINRALDNGADWLRLDCDAQEETDIQVYSVD